MKISVPAAAIGVLVLADLGAFVAVHQHSRAMAGPAVTSTAPAPQTSSSLGGPSSAQPSAAATGVASSARAAIPARTVFATAVSADRGWRAVNSGGCNGSVRVQASQDGGRTWSTLAEPPAGAADAIGIDGTGHLQLSGQASGGCAQKSWSLANGGSWYASDAGDWVPKGAKSGAVMHAGKQVQACDAGAVIDIATAGNAAEVLCSDGTVRKVTASGKPQTVYQGAGLLSIGTAGDKTIVVARSVPGCDGVRLDTLAASGSAQPITCVQGAPKAVDLTFAGDKGWLIAANNTWTGGVSGNWSKS